MQLIKSPKIYNQLEKHKQNNKKNKYFITMVTSVFCFIINIYIVKEQIQQ